MMLSEFFERTRIEPSFEEYHYIEESYYEFDGNKDEFCKAWLKDKKSGKWELEYRLRKELDSQKSQYEEELKEKEETLIFYRTYTEELKRQARTAEKQLREIKQILGINAPEANQF